MMIVGPAVFPAAMFVTLVLATNAPLDPNAGAEAVAAGGFLAAVGITVFVAGLVIVLLERRARLRRDALALAAWSTRQAQQRAQWFADLVTAFGEDAAHAIVRQELWVGAPEAAVYAMFGAPHEIDERVLKTKRKRVLKWRDPSHAARWAMKVTVEDSVVIGWER